MGIKESRLRLKQELKEKTIGYILAAFGFVASLAWNEAIKSLIDQFFPHSNNSVLIKFVYAGVVTVLLVTVTMYLLKVEQKNESR